MKTVLTLLGVGACVLFGGVAGAEPVTTVPGLVTDEGGKPLAGVKVQLCGMEALRDGIWKREGRLGGMPSWTTDKQGRFAIEFKEPDIRYDLWFDKRGYAPTFLNGISADSGELKAVLRRGVIVTGTVTRLADGEEKPLEWAKVVLSQTSSDMGYQQEEFTDREGRYRFHASRAPEGRKWFVTFLNEGVEIEIGEKDPVPGPDFVVALTVKERAEEAGAEPMKQEPAAATITVDELRKDLIGRTVAVTVGSKSRGGGPIPPPGTDTAVGDGRRIVGILESFSGDTIVLRFPPPATFGRHNIYKSGVIRIEILREGDRRPDTLADAE